MRTIFQIKTCYGIEDAAEDLAKWLYAWSDEFDYQGAKFEDALTTAKEFLAENQRRRFIET